MESCWKPWLRFKSGILSILGFGFVGAALVLASSEGQEWHAGAGSVVKVMGDSSVHAYTIEVTAYQVSLKHSNGTYLLSVEVDVSGMKSGKKIMDGKMFDALKAEHFSKILFQGQTKRMEEAKEDVCVFKGSLQIAGMTRDLSLTSSLQKTAAGWNLRGEQELFMTDWNVIPPTAMMGLLKTDKKIKVTFDVPLST